MEIAVPSSVGVAVLRPSLCRKTKTKTMFSVLSMNDIEMNLRMGPNEFHSKGLIAEFIFLIFF